MPITEGHQLAQNRPSGFIVIRIGYAHTHDEGVHDTETGAANVGGVIIVAPEDNAVLRPQDQMRRCWAHVPVENVCQNEKKEMEELPDRTQLESSWTASSSQ